MTVIFGASADAETIQLEQEHGVYTLSVQINGQMTIPFVLDSGAAEVAIPVDVFRTLKRTGTVKDSDFVGAGTYILADGSKQPSQRFLLREVKVGDHIIKDVIANIIPMEGNALLGQSFLSKLPAWSIDNARHAFVLNDGTRELQATAAGTLDRIAQEKSIRIAYREDTPPFSYKDKIGEPSGFMVDLCRAVAKHLADQRSLLSLNVVYVPVTATDRFEAITPQKADLLCEPTSASLSRRELVDFSIPTFLDGAGLMVRADGPKNLRDLAGKKIGVLAGTTTEEALRNTLKEAGITSDLVAATTHDEGLAMLDEGKISAYFGNRSILQFLIKESKAPEKLRLADDYLSVELYALALPRGDSDFRLAVDRALSHIIYPSGEIRSIFQRTFGGKAEPSQILRTLYLFSSLPD
jgi:ABC-type amino acid transport substrate-binding protein